MSSFIEGITDSTETHFLTYLVIYLEVNKMVGGKHDVIDGHHAYKRAYPNNLIEADKLAALKGEQ